MSLRPETDAVLLAQRYARLMTIAGTAALFAVVLAAATIPVVSGHYVQTHADAAFALTSCSLIVTAGALWTVIQALQRASECDAAQQLLATAPFGGGLTGVGRGVSSDADTALMASAAGVGGAACGLGVTVK